jgi:hypothetical protein
MKHFDLYEKYIWKYGGINGKMMTQKFEPNRTFLNNGDIFRTHADVLNECFGFQCRQYQRAYKVLDENYAIWFPTIAKRIEGEYGASDNSYGWVNVISEHNTLITEKNEEKSKNKIREAKYELDRFVFAKFGKGYTFIGVFRPESVAEPWKTGYRYKLIGTKVDLKTMKILE